MNILSFFSNHHHYWGIPHERCSDNRLIQTCYECGAERVIKVNLRPVRVHATAPLEDRQIEAA